MILFKKIFEKNEVLKQTKSIEQYVNDTDHAYRYSMAEAIITYKLGLYSIILSYMSRRTTSLHFESSVFAIKTLSLLQYVS